MHNLALTIQWRESVATGSGFISSRNYTKEYLGFDSISDRELNAICAAVNTYYKGIRSKLRVITRAGEIMPTLARNM